MSEDTNVGIGMVYDTQAAEIAELKAAIYSVRQRLTEMGDIKALDVVEEITEPLMT